MQYSICVAADCDGEKVNLRFLFDKHGPSVTRLLSRANLAFNNLFRGRHITRSFVSSSAVVFNDEHCTWDRLERSTQLLHNSQVYLFQPDVLDIPAEIPEPFEGLPLLGDAHDSPRRQPSPSPSRSRSPRAARPSHYAPRPPFTHRSPHATSARRAQPYDVRERGGGQFFDDAHALTVGGLVRSEKSPSYRAAAGHGASSSSPPFRVLDESQYSGSRWSGYRSSGDRRSILRDEREKIEQQFHMPLDEMRRSLKEETREMSRSISPQRQVTY